MEVMKICMNKYKTVNVLLLIISLVFPAMLQAYQVEWSVFDSGGSGKSSVSGYKLIDSCNYGIIQKMVGPAGSSISSGYVNESLDVSVVAQPFVGVISGKVTKTDGVTGINGATIEVVSGQLLVVSSAMTDSGGNYSVIVATGVYDVKFQNANYKMQIATGVVVEVNRTTELNFVLDEQPGKLSGKVTTSSGAVTLQDVIVELYRSGIKISTTTADVAGSYIFQVYSGEYTVKASSVGYFTKVSSNIVLTEGQIVNNVNLDLEKIISPGIVVGKVMQSNASSPLSNVLVEATVSGIIKASEYTSADGLYSIQLSSGLYDLKFSRDGYVAYFTTTAVYELQITTVNITLYSPNAWITGYVKHKDKITVLKNVQVSVYDESLVNAQVTATVFSNDIGYFELKLSTPGSGVYTVKVNAVNYQQLVTTGVVVNIDTVSELNFYMNRIPGAITLSSPKNGVKGQSINLTLSWSDVYDPDFGDIVKYEIYVTSDTRVKVYNFTLLSKLAVIPAKAGIQCQLSRRQ